MARRILIATDAWHPQINGVVTALDNLKRELESRGFIVVLITPDDFKTIPVPFYPEVKLALTLGIDRMLDGTEFDYVHIPTEGPIGLAARNWCVRNKIKFTTCFHTKHEDIVNRYLKVPKSLTKAYLRWFHSESSGVLVIAPSLRKSLVEDGFERVVSWSIGIDHDLYTALKTRKIFTQLRHKIYLYVGRVSKEKNLEAFLGLSMPGVKIVIGDGPELNTLKAKYPGTKFIGIKKGIELANWYKIADVFVFPSRSDTYGIVLLEAMASGLPIAAFPVSGPMDIVTEKTGVLSEDLKAACLKCNEISKADCSAEADKYSWQRSANEFIETLVDAHERLDVQR